MTETTRTGWVMVSKRKPEFIFDWTWAHSKDAALKRYVDMYDLESARREYKPVKATMTITLEDK